MAAFINPSFTFINLSHPDDLKDRDTISHVRQTAMTRVGMLRKMRNSKKTKFGHVFELQPPEYSSSDREALSRVGLETLDPFACCPFPLDAAASRLCSNFFGTNDGYSLVLRSAWSFIGFHNELSFRTLLSNSALYSQMLQSGRFLTGDTAESLQLHNRALQMMHQRLDNPEERTSDGVIGSMSGFLMYDFLTDNFTGWNRHMAGLLMMLSLRGGFETLNEEQFPVILSWTDICGCYAQDLAPHLPLPGVWLQSVVFPFNIYSSAKKTSLCQILNEELPQARNWKALYELLFSLVSDPEKPPNTWMEPMLHRLLSLRPMHPNTTPSRASLIEEVCRLGALLFLAPIWRSFGIHPVRSKRIRQNLLALLNGHLVEWGKLRVLLLWALAHATREADEEGERAEFAVRLAMVMRKMGLAGLEDLINEARGVLWTEGCGESWKEVQAVLEGITRIRILEK
ncbi:hypothetical protein IQ07DRAFT_667113 [Pyrenochaeta sp. DS3sAY3a]|nr:hypothetical protein IQ07DRAFT_667113 [Pyrenochaeta sp. DS3sAY3a]